MTNARAIEWPEKDPAEKFLVRFDFADEMSEGETIGSVAVTVLLRAGTDATPANLLNGAAQLGAMTVDQPVKAGNAGATYGLRCEATISANRVLVRAALLPVREAV